MLKILKTFFGSTSKIDQEATLSYSCGYDIGHLEEESDNAIQLLSMLLDEWGHFNSKCLGSFLRKVMFMKK